MVSVLRGSRCTTAPHECSFRPACCAIVGLLHCRMKRGTQRLLRFERWEASVRGGGKAAASTSPDSPRRRLRRVGTTVPLEGPRERLVTGESEEASSVAPSLKLRRNGRWGVLFPFDCNQAAMLVTGMVVCVNTITETLVCCHPLSRVSDGTLWALVKHHCRDWIRSTAGTTKRLSENPPFSSSSSSSPVEGQPFAERFLHIFLIKQLKPTSWPWVSGP